MAATAWPFGDIKASLPRISFRWPRGMDARDAERQKAEIERAFRSVDDALIQIDRRLSSLDTSVKASFGYMSAAGVVAGANITTSWTDVTGFTTNGSPNVGVTFDAANNRFKVDAPGLYQLNFTSFLEHNTNAAVRLLHFRLDTIPATTIDLGIAKNVDSTVIGIGRILPVPVANVWSKLQVSASATVSSIQWHDMALEMTRLGDL